jgi:hypothetical protein
MVKKPIWLYERKTLVDPNDPTLLDFLKSLPFTPTTIPPSDAENQSGAFAQNGGSAGTPSPNSNSTANSSDTRLAGARRAERTSTANHAPQHSAQPLCSTACADPDPAATPATEMRGLD